MSKVKHFLLIKRKAGWFSFVIMLKSLAEQGINEDRSISSTQIKTLFIIKKNPTFQINVLAF